jgi:hypothetical protein
LHWFEVGGPPRIPRRRVVRQRGVDLATRGVIEAAQKRCLAVDLDPRFPPALGTVPVYTEKPRGLLHVQVDPELQTAGVVSGLGLVFAGEVAKGLLVPTVLDPHVPLLVPRLPGHVFVPRGERDALVHQLTPRQLDPNGVAVENLYFVSCFFAIGFLAGFFVPDFFAALLPPSASQSA